MQHIKPIETRYKGFRFRSRLEARWAVFFDELGLKWEYEPEGFELGNGIRYLPDFRITAPTGHVQWYEVKPPGVESDGKLDLFRTLIRYSDIRAPRADLLSGDPMRALFEAQAEQRVWLCPRCGNCCEPPVLVVPPGEWGRLGDTPSGEVHFRCYPCDADTPDGADNPVEPGVLAPSAPHKGDLIVRWADSELMAHRLKQAATAARGARFEHGQSGARA